MRLFVVLSLFLLGCGSLTFTPNGHRLLYKSKNGEVSCYTNNCCWPYKEKLMTCTVAEVDNVSIVIKFVPDK